jgi:hypothetical protein
MAADNRQTNWLCAANSLHLPKVQSLSGENRRQFPSLRYCGSTGLGWLISLMGGQLPKIDARHCIHSRAIRCQAMPEAAN